MELTIPDLTRRFDSLLADQRTLPEKLREFAQILQNGEIPPWETIDELKFYRQRYIDLQQEVAPDLAVEDDEFIALPELQKKINLVTQRDFILESMRTLQRLAHRDAGQVEVVQEYHETLQRLLANVEKIGTQSMEPAEWSQLCEGCHPVQLAVRMIDAGETLSDDEWETLLERIRSAFGRRFATALVRGHLQLT